MNSLAPPPPNENQLWFQRPRCGDRGGEQDGVRGPSNRTENRARAYRKAEMSMRKDVTDWVNRRDGQVRPALRQDGTDVERKEKKMEWGGGEVLGKRQ